MLALLFFAGMANAQVVVDFETGDFSQLAPYGFSTSGYSWTVENVIMSGSSYLAQSGNAGQQNSTSSFEITVNFGEPGYILFDAKCMGEGGIYGSVWDQCLFSIDGDVVFMHGAEVEGWNTYGYNVAVGSHTFTWSYVKDGSTNPDGDCFQVDNITFGPGSACVVPTWVEAETFGSNVYLEWNGVSDSYTLRYKKGTGSWTTIPGITDNEYIIEDLSTGEYKVEVQSDCVPGQWANTDFMIYNPVSWSDWYGFSPAAFDPANNNRFLNFKMDLATVNAASDEMTWINAATFANGNIWMVMENPETWVYCLYKAPINIYENTIGTPELVTENFNVVAMSYNPVNGRVYYIDSSDNLKSFDIANPGPITSYGYTDYVSAMAIDKDGNAYVNRYNPETSDQELAVISLTDASMTTVGPMDYCEAMAFDMLTGELFAVNNASMYYVDHTNGRSFYLGELGGDEPNDIVTLFMVYDWDAVVESNVESVNVYPNPAQGQVTVEGTGVLSIVNMLGQTILTQEIEEKATIELPKGMYIVRLNNAVSKLVVE